jgi:hypothetical protein
VGLLVIHVKRGEVLSAEFDLMEYDKALEYLIQLDSQTRRLREERSPTTDHARKTNMTSS